MLKMYISRIYFLKIYFLKIYFLYIYCIAAADAAAERSPTEFDSEPFSGILTLKNDFMFFGKCLFFSTPNSGWGQ